MYSESRLEKAKNDEIEKKNISTYHSFTVRLLKLAKFTCGSNPKMNFTITTDGF